MLKIAVPYVLDIQLKDGSIVKLWPTHPEVRVAMSTVDVFKIVLGESQLVQVYGTTFGKVEGIPGLKLSPGDVLVVSGIVADALREQQHELLLPPSVRVCIPGPSILDAGGGHRVGYKGLSLFFQTKHKS